MIPEGEFISIVENSSFFQTRNERDGRREREIKKSARSCIGWQRILSSLEVREVRCQDDRCAKPFAIF